MTETPETPTPQTEPAHLAFTLYQDSSGEWVSEVLLVDGSKVVHRKALRRDRYPRLPREVLEMKMAGFFDSNLNPFEDLVRKM